MKIVKIAHYREKCIGCNSCVEQAPENWIISKSDGKSVLLGSKLKKDIFVREITLDQLDSNIKAARDCPVRIIKILK